MSPNESPPRGNSQKSSAAASDDFSKRVPNGPIVEPAWIAKAVRTPTTARSALDAGRVHARERRCASSCKRRRDRPTFVLRGSDRVVAGVRAATGKQGIIRLASSVADYGSASYPFAQRRKATDEMGAFVETGQDFSAQGETRDFERIVGDRRRR